MITCIVLAAGSSTRFGSPKPLAQINSQPAIEFILRKLLLTELSEIIVVLGCDADKITPFIPKEERVKYVINANYELGQTSSFKTGLSLVNADSKGIMLLPVDMPCIKPKTINELIGKFLEKSCLILVPTFENHRGHPPIFSCQLKEEFLQLKNNQPISAVLHNHEAEIIQVPITDEGVVLSFNTPEELKKIQQSL